jgi:tRNA pseudouridine55 synthase
MLLVDKPAGISSHDVVVAARRAYGERSIGHLGTLDPFATGLLILLFGRATRLATFIETEPKEYDATIRFGAETATDDCTGAVSREAAPPSMDAVIAAIPSLTGKIRQLPPDFSAKSVGGTRAYAAARKGEPISLAPVEVDVFEWRIRSVREREIDVTIECGTGTYVRALARDLGRATGSAAHLASLRRTRSGPYRVADAVSLDAIQGDPPPLLTLKVSVADA